MSASLVGSEMCIRDSALPDHPAHARGRGFDLQAGARAGERVGPRVDLPVSYTHLTLPTICSV
eukprot:2745594-Alexandrium_andersonii.AAC.1